jgi:hypothetical protein
MGYWLLPFNIFILSKGIKLAENFNKRSSINEGNSPNEKSVKNIDLFFDTSTKSDLMLLIVRFSVM